MKPSDPEFADAISKMEAICARLEENILMYGTMLLSGKMVPVILFDGFASRMTVKKWISQGLRHDYFNGKLCVDCDQFFEFFYRCKGGSNPNHIQKTRKP